MPETEKKQGGHRAPGYSLSESQLINLLQYVRHKADLARQNGTTRAVVDELIILLLVDTGLRASELCNLNIEDLPTSHGENTIWVRDPEGNVTRAVEVGPETARCLDRFVSLYRKGAETAEPLLISERGRRLTYMSLYSKVKKIGRKTDIAKLHPHVLRRTYLVKLYSLERDLRFVQTRAGHASPATTAIYARATHKGPKGNAETAGGDASVSVSMRGSNGEPITPEYSMPPAGSIAQKDSCLGPQQIKTCEACGRSVPALAGTRIDSGQLLCPDCLKELRER